MSPPTRNSMSLPLLVAVALLAVPIHAAEDAPTNASPVDASPPLLGSLHALDRLQPGRTMRSSSSDIWNPDQGNADARPIPPGETLVIAELEGPGRIQHIWNTIAAEERGASRLVVVRMYWDGETSPSVEAPLGDFFVIGHGVDRPVQSLPVVVTAEGRARNCYWPMPFRRSAKITVTNEGTSPVQAFYYYVDWQKLPSLPADTAYFHAQYRQEHPVSADKNYLIADIAGRGHYVGTVLNVRQRTGGWFGEGDDFFYIDGEEHASLRGTGTEDYFGDAWGFRESNNPYYGIPLFEHYKPGGLITAYRWHIPDPVSFEKSLRVEIEHKGAAFDDQGAVRSGYEVREDDFSSVAYWYQIEPHKPFPALPRAQDRLYPRDAGLLEPETLLERIKATEGDVSSQAGQHWSGGAQLWWRATKEGQSLSIPFTIERDGVYDLALALTVSHDYGRFDVAVDGQVVKPAVELYAAEISAVKQTLDNIKLSAGDHVLEFRNVGKAEPSGGYFLGLDSIQTAAQP